MTIIPRSIHIAVTLITVYLIVLAHGIVPKRVSIITGASGFIGRTIVHEMLSNNEDCVLPVHCNDIYALVRSEKVSSEQEYWDKELGGVTHTGGSGPTVTVCAYDMLDGGKSLSECLDKIRCKYCNDNPDYIPADLFDGVDVYHVASKFGPTEDHETTALENVRGTEDLVRTCSEYAVSVGIRRLAITSSMAAVRATNQEPLNGEYYTEQDWNTKSELGANWGASYQWSKAESERRAWELVNADKNLSMVSLCPSFVFGPIRGELISSSSFSIDIVGKWARGLSEVQSRLCVDVRDVAKAHVRAMQLHGTAGERFIVSAESRLPSADVADEMRRIANEVGVVYGSKITADEDFDGGAIKIGDQEVGCEKNLREKLGISCRPVLNTFGDMTRNMYRSEIEDKLASMVLVEEEEEH